MRRAFRATVVSLFALLSLAVGLPGGAAAQGAGQSEIEACLAAFERGAFDTAVESFTQAARLAQQRGDHEGQIVALVHAAEGYAALGSYRQAVGLLDRALQVAEATLRGALEMAREGGDQALAAGLLNDLGNQLASRKAMPEAIAAYRESASLAAVTGQELLAASARTNESGTQSRLRSFNSGSRQSRAL